MSEKPDGGPAFPQSLANDKRTERIWSSLEKGEGGMSLRDYFAAKALQALIGLTPNVLNKTAALPQEMTSAAYSFADAMLAERDK